MPVIHRLFISETTGEYSLTESHDIPADDLRFPMIRIATIQGPLSNDVLQARVEKTLSDVQILGRSLVNITNTYREIKIAHDAVTGVWLDIMQNEADRLYWDGRARNREMDEW